MSAAKCVVSLILLTVVLGAVHLGAEDHGESLGEPLFRLIREQPEEIEPAEAARTKAVNTSSRSAVVSFFYSEYTPSLSVPMQWTGNVATCTAGTTFQAYVDATLQMIKCRAGSDFQRRVRDWKLKCLVRHDPMRELEFCAGSNTARSLQISLDSVVGFENPPSVIERRCYAKERARKPV